MPMPPLAAIRVFEAVARHLSFTRAADELGMTQAGVSYQIRVLEERLGSALFLRRPREVALTRLGEELARPTTEAFTLLRNTYDTDAMRAETLSISALSSFAANWLAPRLGQFQLAHQEIAVRLETSDRRIDFQREDFDVAIRYGHGNWPGIETVELMRVLLTPMLSPKLMAERQIQSPKDLLSAPLLDSSNPDWAIWFDAVGINYPRPAASSRLVLGTQISEARAAVAGQGVALLNPRFFRIEIATGALVQPFPEVAAQGNAYWLIYPTSYRNRASIRKFRSFLLEEVANEAMDLRSSDGSDSAKR